MKSLHAYTVRQLDLEDLPKGGPDLMWMCGTLKRTGWLLAWLELNDAPCMQVDRVAGNVHEEPAHPLCEAAVSGAPA